MNSEATTTTETVPASDVEGTLHAPRRTHQPSDERRLADLGLALCELRALRKALAMPPRAINDWTTHIAILLKTDDLGETYIPLEFYALNEAGARAYAERVSEREAMQVVSVRSAR